MNYLKSGIFVKDLKRRREEKMVFIGGDVGIFIYILKNFFVLLLNV